MFCAKKSAWLTVTCSFCENLDGKSKSVVLTKKGQKFVKEKVLPITDMEDKIFSSWTKTELEVFIGLCERYKNQLAAEVASYER